MNRPRLVRALRIAWSVAWGPAAILLVALWVRSYVSRDLMYLNTRLDRFGDGSNFTISWMDGSMMLAKIPSNEIYSVGGPFGFMSIRRDVYSSQHTFWGVGYYSTSFGPMYVAPMWLLIVGACTIGAVTWEPFRFSLRTLLIAMTLVAVGLGLVAWLTH
jgi:hypothetical protein